MPLSSDGMSLDDVIYLYLRYRYKFARADTRRAIINKLRMYGYDTRIRQYIGLTGVLPCLSRAVSPPPPVCSGRDCGAHPDANTGVLPVRAAPASEGEGMAVSAGLTFSIRDWRTQQNHNTNYAAQEPSLHGLAHLAACPLVRPYCTALYCTVLYDSCYDDIFSGSADLPHPIELNTYTAGGCFFVLLRVFLCNFLVCQPPPEACNPIHGLPRGAT